MSADRLTLKATEVSWRNKNCWKRLAWMKALAWTHFDCSTVTLRPWLLRKHVHTCNRFVCMYIDSTTKNTLVVCIIKPIKLTSRKCTAFKMEDRFLALSILATST